MTEWINGLPRGYPQSILSKQFHRAWGETGMQTAKQSQAEGEQWQEPERPAEASSRPVEPSTGQDDSQDVLGAEVRYAPPAGSQRSCVERYRVMAECVKRYLGGPTLVRYLLEPCEPQMPQVPHPKADNRPFWVWAQEVRRVTPTKEEHT